MFMRRFGVVIVPMIVTSFVPGPATAQPSGGPYGPVQLNYQVPPDAKHVYYVAPDGSQDSAGDRSPDAGWQTAASVAARRICDAKVSTSRRGAVDVRHR